MEGTHNSSNSSTAHREQIKRVLRRVLGFNYASIVSEQQLEQAAMRIEPLEQISAQELETFGAEIAGDANLFKAAERTLNAVLAELHGNLPAAPEPKRKPRR